MNGAQPMFSIMAALCATKPVRNTIYLSGTSVLNDPHTLLITIW